MTTAPTPAVSAAAQSFLSKIAFATATTRADRFRDGMYLLTVKKIECDQKRNGVFFIVEFIVDESKAVSADADKQPNAVGTTVGIAHNLSLNDSSAGNVKSFITALLDEADSTGEELIPVLNTLCGPGQPARGMRIRMETYRVPQKKDPKKDYLGQNWKPVIQSPEETAKRRAEVEAAK